MQTYAIHLIGPELQLCLHLIASMLHVVTTRCISIFANIFKMLIFCKIFVKVVIFLFKRIGFGYLLENLLINYCINKTS